MRIFIGLFFLSFIAIEVNAQYVPEEQMVNRIEEPLDGFRNENTAIPLGFSKEVIIFRKTKEKTRGELGRMDIWRVTKYNKKLNQEWTDEVLGIKNGFIYDYKIDE